MMGQPSSTTRMPPKNAPLPLALCHWKKNLKVLSLGRNLIKSLAGIEGAGETLEQLWISYNQIDKLKPIRNMTKLHTLYMAHNLVG